MGRLLIAQRSSIKNYMNKSFNKKILQQIDGQDLKPKSGFYFRLREIVLWIGTIISLLLAGILMGSFVFQVSNTMILPPQIGIVFAVVRIVLIILALLFALAQILNTEKGYKRTKKLYIILGIFCAISIGSVLFFTNISGHLESRIGQGGIINQSKSYWTQPESGLLAGELQEITNEGYLIIEGFDGGYHVVDGQYIPEQEQDILIDFLRVRMVGFEKGEIFYPCSVMPWELKGAPKKRKDDHLLYQDNIQFSQAKRPHNMFKKIFERKSEIVRTNKC